MEVDLVVVLYYTVDNDDKTKGEKLWTFIPFVKN